MRNLDEVLKDMEELPRYTQPTVLSGQEAALLTSLLGEQGLELLNFLDGREQCADIAWNLDSISGFANTMFADLLGAEAPYTIVAFSGSGDAWAIDWADAKMVFLNHDGMEQDTDYPMVVPLGIEFEELVRVADAWADYEERVDAEEIDEEILLSDFLRRLEAFKPNTANNWPYA